MSFTLKNRALVGVEAGSAVPARGSLVAQTLAWLTHQVGAGRWNRQMPSERELCRALQISRGTLRAALAEMKRQGIIRSTPQAPRAGNLIVARNRPARPRNQAQNVALVTRVLLDESKPHLMGSFDALRAMLNEKGQRLHVFVGKKYFQGRCEQALQSLTTLHPHGCWIPIGPTELMQRWFQKSRLPVVLGGMSLPEVDLPCVDSDYRAMSRHAGGVLLRLGHRRVAYLTQSPESRRPRDLESREGFAQSIALSGLKDAELMVCHYDLSAKGLDQILWRLISAAARPTALIVENPNCYLMVTTLLTKFGWRIPDDISVICQSNAPFLSYLRPVPCRYSSPPPQVTREFFRLARELIENGYAKKRRILLMPEFIRGESIGPPAAPVRRPSRRP